jgi:hypothetical protein
MQYEAKGHVKGGKFAVSRSLQETDPNENTKAFWHWPIKT